MPETSFNVYAVGNALVDIQARVTDAQLVEIGFEKGLMTLVDEDTQRGVIQNLRGIELNCCAGGSAANTIMGVADFGGRAAFCGKVGNDEVGTVFLDDLRRVGVQADVPPADGVTGTCVVLITEDAQRTMLTNLAASITLDVPDVNETDIQHCQYVYIEGYLFTGPATRAAALKAIELARANGIKVALTVSDPFVIDLNRDEFWSLIEGPVDLLFCNEQEAKSLTGKNDPIDCAHAIHKHTENVALTLGGNGSILMHEGDVIPIEGVTVDAIDTTGAGDMYAAGILYGITNGLTWKQSGHLASHAAARIVSQMGARLANPFTADEIRSLLS